jgi:DNA-directed RNA polymerase specialized sigma24 family protein
LLDYGRILIRQQRREQAAGDGSAQVYNEHDGSPGAEPRRGADGKARVWLGDFFLSRLLDTKSWEDWEYMRDSGRFEQSRYPLLYATKIDGLTQDEIAGVTGWSVSTVKSRVAEEKRRLAAEFYGS